MAERQVTPVPEKFAHAKTIYSFSRLSNFSNCPYGYHLAYNLKQRGKDNIYSVLGTLCHDLIEKLEVGEIDREVALKDFDNSLFEITEIKGYKFSSDKVRDNFVKSMRHFFQHYKRIEASKVLIEKEFYTSIENVVLKGFIDLITLKETKDKDGKVIDTKVEVIDLKTSSKYATKDLEEYGRQLVVYALALEQEFGIKVDRVAWNMLKYTRVVFQGATKQREGFYLRAEVVKKLRSELKKDLRKEGLSEAQMEILLAKAEETNDMTLFSKEIQDKYQMLDGYVEYPITVEVEENLREYISRTVRDIESKDQHNESEWYPLDIEENSFFCSSLCGQPTCRHYVRYLNTLTPNNIFGSKSNPSISDEVKNLFG